VFRHHFARFAAEYDSHYAKDFGNFRLETISRVATRFLTCALAQNIARAPLSLQKLTYDQLGGKVIYHTAYNLYFKQNTRLWSAADFIAQLTQFIPPWGVRYMHYYGLYSSVQGTVPALASRRACRPASLEKLARRQTPHRPRA
jgi:hypothetical protein